MNLKRTEWYPEEILPSVPGVYEVLMPHNDIGVSWFAYWNGHKFGFRVGSYHKDPSREAIIRRDSATCLGDRVTWRGLTKQSFLMMKEQKHAL